MKRTTWLAALVAFMAVVVLFQDAFARSRMYHPSLGRFMQRDVLGYVDGMSLYQYTGSNPIVRTDPTGGCDRPTNPQTQMPMVPFTPGIQVLTKGKATGNCGGAMYSIAWTIPQVHQSSSGKVIQKVQWSFDIKDRDKKDITPPRLKQYNTKPYWEAWSFGILRGVGSTVSPINPDFSNDIFRLEEFPDDSKGTVLVSGEAKGATNYVLPPNFQPGGAGPLSGTLPATWMKPGDWDNTPAGVTHSMTVKWDCCASPKQFTQVQANP